LENAFTDLQKAEVMFTKAEDALGLNIVQKTSGQADIRKGQPARAKTQAHIQLSNSG